MYRDFGVNPVNLTKPSLGVANFLAPRVKQDRTGGPVGAAIREHLVDVARRDAEIVPRRIERLPLCVENGAPAGLFDHGIGPQSKEQFAVFFVLQRKSAPRLQADPARARVAGCAR